MISAFESIRISTPDVAEASRQLAILLGAPAVGEAGNLFLLQNTAIDLVAGDGGDSVITSLAMLADQPQERLPPFAQRHHSVMATSELDAFRTDSDAVSQLAVDHVVVQVRDADAAIALYRDTLGIRLALDKEVPQWGGRMLFFRAGKMTLEVIANPEKGPAEPSFWGIALQCSDIEATAARLQSVRVELSEIRDGRKPGTRVATLKSHCLGLPTLLIQPAASTT